MTATDQMLTAPRGPGADRDMPAPLTVSFAPNWPLRNILLQVAGTALILSAAGMWLVAGRDSDAQMMMIRLGISVFFFFCGLTVLMRNHVDTRPDAQFDAVRRELRVLQKNNRGVPQTVMTRGYDSLGRVEIVGERVELFDLDGSVLMRLEVSAAETREALRRQLSGAVASAV